MGETGLSGSLASRATSWLDTGDREADVFASLQSEAGSAVVDTLRAAGCVFAEDEARLLLSAASSAEELAAMVARRAAGLPLEHVIGWVDFCGARIVVDVDVFIPRPRTQLLVAEAVTLARRPRPRPAVVVDMCCGSGAVGVAVATALDRFELHATDIEPAAVRCARRNVEPTEGQVYEGDLFEPLPATLQGRVDVLVANTPYVPTAELVLLPSEARLHEPRTALDGGADGLDVQRRVAAEAPRWLARGGHLLFETSRRQAPAASAVLSQHGLTARVTSCEVLEATVVIGTRPR